MPKVASSLTIVVSSFIFLGCSIGGSRYYDSAMNDRNRAPASFKIPLNYESGHPIIDPLHNQTEADFLYLKAEMKSSEGKSAEALELYKSILVYDPNSATVKQKMAIEYYRRGQVRDALYWAEKAKSDAPKEKDINMLLGGLYSATKNYPKALQVYNEILKNNPDDTETHLYLGAIYSEQKNNKKAIEHLTILSKDLESSSRYLAHYYIARIYYDQNQKKENSKAEMHLRKALEIKPDFYEGLVLLGKMIEQKSNKKKAYEFYISYQTKKGPFPKLAEMLSQYYIESNDYDKAYEQLEILEASYEDQPQVKLKMTLILIDKKMYDLASKKLIEILENTPDSDKVRFYLAAVYEELKQYQKSFEQYMQITESSNYYEESRVQAALLSKTMNQIDRAIEILQSIDRRNATSPQVYFLMAQFFDEKNQPEKSFESLQKGIGIFPDVPQLYFYQGVLYEKNNQPDKMIASMKKVLSLDPQNSQAMNYLAYSWADQGIKLDEAEKLARKAVNLEKNDGFILDTLGWVLYKKGSFEEAQILLEKAHKLQPKAGIIAEHLGDVYIKNQKFDKARALFLKAIELETNTVRKNEINIKINLVESVLQNTNRAPASLEANGK